MSLVSASGPLRHDWSRTEVEALFALPFPVLLHQAAEAHRANFDPAEVQVSTLLSVKTGGCPEDCAYCPQAQRYHTGVEATKLMDTDAVVERAKAAKAAGAMFGVSPGATDRIIAACEDEGLPLLPGAATATEIMVLLEKGYTVQKFFPAEQAGGAAYLKSIGSPIPQVKFCPTGGISLKIAPDYLGLKNILCVGGSWVAPKEAMAKGDCAEVTRLAREAAALSR